MALAGTGDALGLAIKAAREAVSAALLAKLTDVLGNVRQATADELAQLKIDMAKAEGRAIVDHIVTNAVVSGTATGVAAGIDAAPITGKVG